MQWQDVSGRHALIAVSLSTTFTLSVATWNAVHTAEDRHFNVLTSTQMIIAVKCSTDIGRVIWIANDLASKIVMAVQL
jgi:hypothetical protein